VRLRLRLRLREDPAGSASRPNIVWARMSGLDLSEGAPSLKLDLADDTGLEGGLVGDVTDRFTEAPPMRFLPAR